MTIILRCFLIVFCSVFFLYIIRLVKQRRLLLKYSLLWLALSIVLCLSAAFPDLVSFFSDCFGFQVASNFIFFVAVLFLLAICLSLSVIASKQTAYIKTLVQEIALLKHGIDGNADGL